MADSTYDVTTPAGQVRLLLNDVGAPWVFNDDEIAAFLALESQNVKRAAAQAIDSNADNQALAAKVITTRDGSVNGAAVADSLRKRAQTLRDQALFDEENGDEGFVFELVDIDPLLIVDPDFPDRTYIV